MKMKVQKMIKDTTIEPTHLCPLCRWDMDEGSFYIWDFSRRKLFCSNCGTNFYSGDVVFDHDIGRYQYVGNNSLFLAANVFWSMRFSSEKDFFEQMASYDISEKTASHALKELTGKGIVEKRGKCFLSARRARDL
jgi:hypothetical protein